MNKRQVKKEAKKYYQGRLKFPVYEEGGYGMNGQCYKLFASLGARIEREVLSMAYKMGWDGNHWDNPLVIEYYYMDDEETYYSEFAPKYHQKGEK